MAVKKFLKDVESLRNEFRHKNIPQPKARHDHHDESNWLVSYADMMTLLCGFFIMLFSLSKLDEPKFEKLKEEVSKKFGGVYQAPTGEMKKFATQIIQELGIEKEASVKSNAYGVVVEFQSTLFFDTLSAEIKPEGKTVLNKIVQKIAEKQIKDLKEYPVLVEGHTDSQPIISGIYPSNWELSAARAARVTRVFIEHGFNPSKLSAMGLADTQPVDTNFRTPAGEWNTQALTKNRRVIIRIFRPDYKPEYVTDPKNAI